MTIESSDTVFYTAVFLLPGFVVYSLVGFINPIKQKQTGELFLSYFGYSVICAALFSVPYTWIVQYKDQIGVLYWIVLIVAMLLIAAFVGLIFGLSQKSKWLRRVSIFGHHIIDPVPTAWDKVFSKDISRWVRVQLKDGSCITGLFSSNSFCSSYDDGPDLYLEKIYNIDENGNPIEIERSQGIYIKGKDINYIEFYEW